MKTKALILVVVLVFAGQASAVDLNSTTSLRYFPDNNLEFQVQPDGTINTRGDIQLNGNNIDTSGNTITLRDTTNNQDILRAKENGNVQIANGNLTGPNGGNIFFPNSAEAQDLVLDASGAGEIFLNSPLQGDGNIKLKSGVNFNDHFLQQVEGLEFNPDQDQSLGYFSSDGVFRVRDTSEGGAVDFSVDDGEVSVPRGNLDVSGNNITNIDTLKFEEGTSIDGNVSIDGSLNTSGDLDLNGNDLLDANTVETNIIDDPEDNRIDTNDELDFNSNRGLVNVRNINVRSFTSNSGLDDIQFNQGFTVDGSAGGDGGVTLSGSGGLDVNAAGGDNQQNPPDSLRVGGHINFDGGIASNPVLRTPGGGSDSIRIYDDANNQDIARFKEGGSVRMANGNLNVGGTITSSAGTGFVLTGGGAGEDTEIVARNTGDSFIRVFQNGNQQNARLGLTDSSDTIVDLQARDGTIGPQNANLRLNSGYGIENGAGTKAINVDSNADVEIPNGNLNISQGSGIGDLSGNERISIGGNTVLRGKGNARVKVETNNVKIRASTNSRTVAIRGGGTAFARFNPDNNRDLEIVNGDIEMLDGDIDLRGNRVVDNTGSDTVYVGDADSNTVRVDAGGSGDAVVSSGDGGSGSTERLRVTSSGGEADVDVSNSDVDLQGNSVTSSSGEVCIGDECA